MLHLKTMNKTYFGHFCFKSNFSPSKTKKKKKSVVSTLSCFYLLAVHLFGWCPKSEQTLWCRQPEGQSWWDETVAAPASPDPDVESASDRLAAAAPDHTSTRASPGYGTRKK